MVTPISKHFLRVLLIVMLMCQCPCRLFAQKGASPAQPQNAASGQSGGQGGATPYFETQMQAYGGVNQISEVVVRQVCNDFQNQSVKPTIIIFDPTSFQNLQAWQTFIASTAALKDAYETLLSSREITDLFPSDSQEPFLGLAFFPITSGSDFASLVTAFASSTTNNPSAFTIQDSTMAVSLAHQFSTMTSCIGGLIYYPLFGSYVDLAGAKTDVSQAMHDLNILRNYIQLNYIFTGNNDPNFLVFTELNNQYDALLRTISGQGQGGQQGPGQQGSGQQTGSSGPSSNSAPSSASGGSSQSIVSLIQGASLDKLLKQDNTYVLYADVVAAGGTQRDRKNIFTLVTGDWISYSGGVIVNVALIRSQDNALTFADTVRYRSGFAHIKNPVQSKNLEQTAVGENRSSLCGDDKGTTLCNRPNILIPGPVNTPKLAAVQISPNVPNIAGGGVIELTITFPSPLVQQAGVLTFSSSDTSIARVEDLSLQIAANTPSITTHVRTTNVSSSTGVRVTATYRRNNEELGTGNVFLTINEPVSFSRDTVPPGWHGSIVVTVATVVDKDRPVSISTLSGTSISLDQDSISIPAYQSQASVGFTAGIVTTPAQTKIRASIGGAILGEATITVSPGH